ncbi:MAG: hypothetical protein IJV37_05305 [Bacteroidales bacterium]|nr:hypothetical protein [Bacteroidales bacterium]
MKRTVNYLLAGILALLGFSSCASLREARQARQERERQEAEAQQRALVEEVLRKMEADDASRKAAEEAGRMQQQVRIDSIRQGEAERTKLLYAVPNVPYREVKEK